MQVILKARVPQFKIQMLQRSLLNLEGKKKQVIHTFVGVLRLCVIFCERTPLWYRTPTAQFSLPNLSLPQFSVLNLSLPVSVSFPLTVLLCGGDTSLRTALPAAPLQVYNEQKKSKRSPELPEYQMSISALRSALLFSSPLLSSLLSLLTASSLFTCASWAAHSQKQRCSARFQEQDGATPVDKTAKVQICCN